jgi:hypothetical protein
MRNEKRGTGQPRERITRWQELASLQAKYRYAALEHHRSGELEIDDDAEVSLGADGQGAFVQAWLWIPKSEIEQGEK